MKRPGAGAIAVTLWWAAMALGGLTVALLPCALGPFGVLGTFAVVIASLQAAVVGQFGLPRLRWFLATLLAIPLMLVTGVAVLFLGGYAAVEIYRVLTGKVLTNAPWPGVISALVVIPALVIPGLLLGAAQLLAAGSRHRELLSRRWLLRSAVGSAVVAPLSWSVLPFCELALFGPAFPAVGVAAGLGYGFLTGTGFVLGRTGRDAAAASGT